MKHGDLGARTEGKRQPLRGFEAIVLTACGLGLLRPAPGTWGSLPPVVIAFVMASLTVPHWMMNITLALLCLAASIGCVRFGVLGEQLFGKKDAQQIVADEVAGQCIPLLFLPWRAPVDREAWIWNMMLAVSAFIAFRLFDITKPPPIRRMENLPVGWGVLVDDLIAGIYALCALQLLLLLM